MDAIREDIIAAVDKELTAANEKFPMFASLHEAYGVIAEEKYEVNDALNDVNRYIDIAWKQIRNNNSKLAVEHLLRAKDAAINLAIEACQVAAMCIKAKQSMENPLDVKALEEKHWEECRQIAHYDNELQQKDRLLKMAVLALNNCPDCDAKKYFMEDHIGAIKGYIPDGSGD